MRCFIATVLLFLLSSIRGVAITPQRILARMEHRYSACRSYSDSGSFADVSDTKGDSQSFVTYFVRPNHFRFEWTKVFRKMDMNDPFNSPLVRARDIIWSNNNDVFNRIEDTMDKPGVIRKFDKLEYAIGGAAGSSMGTASKVIDLLMNHFLGWGFPKLSMVRLLPETSLAGTRCYRIEGVGWDQKTRCEVLIGKKDYLLRRFRAYYPDGICMEQKWKKIQIDRHIRGIGI
jgi:hypothetical protein